MTSSGGGCHGCRSCEEGEWREVVQLKMKEKRLGGFALGISWIAGTPNKFCKSQYYHSLITYCSALSLLTQDFYFVVFTFVVVRDLPWELLIRCCVLFSGGALFMVVRRQVVLVLVIGLAINVGGKVLIWFFLHNIYRLTIHNKFTSWQFVCYLWIVNPYVTYALSIHSFFYLFVFL